MNEQLLRLIVGAITGGGLVSLLQWYLSLRKAKLSERQYDQSEYQAIIGEMRQERERMGGEIEALRQIEKRLSHQITALQLEMSELRNRLALMVGTNMNLPVAMWIKSPDGRMVFLNDTYERLFLMPIGRRKEEYLGQTDREFWGEEIGKIYEDNDRLADTAVSGLWRIEPYLLHNGEQGEAIVLKFAHKLGEYSLYRVGIAITRKQLAFAYS